jgi:hypothetical protein
MFAFRQSNNNHVYMCVYTVREGPSRDAKYKEKQCYVTTMETGLYSGSDRVRILGRCILAQQRVHHVKGYRYFFINTFQSYITPRNTDSDIQRSKIFSRKICSLLCRSCNPFQQYVRVLYLYDFPI